MRVLVCGGRDYANKDVVFEQLDFAHRFVGIDLIIQGGAKGADALAASWAKAREVECMEIKADWDAHGKAAGPIRNRLMLEQGKPDWVYAFPGGRGTQNMIAQAKTALVSVLVIGDDEPAKVEW